MARNLPNIGTLQLQTDELSSIQASQSEADITIQINQLENAIPPSNQLEKAIPPSNQLEQLIPSGDQSEITDTKGLNQSESKSDISNPQPVNQSQSHPLPVNQSQSHPLPVDQSQRLKHKQLEPDWSGFKGWLHSVAVVTFDLELGQVIEKTFPNHEEFR